MKEYIRIPAYTEMNWHRIRGIDRMVIMEFIIAFRLVVFVCILLAVLA